MKTRKSISDENDGKAKIVDTEKDKSNKANSALSPPYIRKLRSRVIISDNEDETQSSKRTPTRERVKVKKNNEKSVSINNEEIADSSCDDSKELRSPKSYKKNVSAQKLFNITEENEEIKNQANMKGTEETVERENSSSEEGRCEDEAVNIIDKKLIEAVNSDDSELTKDEASSSADDSNSISPKKTSVSFSKDHTENASGGILSYGSCMGKSAVTEESDNEQSEKEEVDSDEDMPEAVSFTSGKDQTNKALKMAADAIRTEKEKRKEQRKRRIKMIMMQKAEKEHKCKEKLKYLETSIPERLTEEIVSTLPDAPEIPTIIESELKSSKRKKGLFEEGVVEMEEVQEKVARKNKIIKFDDYIPIDGVEGATKFGVVPLEIVSRIPKSSSEKAANFKHEALFGSRIKREPSKSLLMYNQKIYASGKDKRFQNIPKNSEVHYFK